MKWFKSPSRLRAPRPKWIISPSMFIPQEIPKCFSILVNYCMLLKYVIISGLEWLSNQLIRPSSIRPGFRGPDTPAGMATNQRVNKRFLGKSHCSLIPVNSHCSLSVYNIIKVLSKQIKQLFQVPCIFRFGGVIKTVTAAFKMENQLTKTWHMRLCSVSGGSPDGRGTWG